MDKPIGKLNDGKSKFARENPDCELGVQGFRCCSKNFKYRTDFPPLADGEVYPSQAPALNFVDVILGKAANGSPGELGLAAMEIIEAACESAQTNRSEKIREVGKSHSKKRSVKKTGAVRGDA